VNRTTKTTIIAAIAIVVIVACIGFIAVSGSGSPRPAESEPSAPKQDAELTREVQNAITAAGVEADIHDVTAGEDGMVFVTMNLTTEDIGSEVAAEDVARSLSTIIFSGVPGATSVDVQDGNRDQLGTFSRQ